MSGFVLDCSIAVAWCFEDEADPLVDGLLDGLQRQGCAVPSLWPIEVDPTVWHRVQAAVLALARLHGLPTYDAAYLELAIRRGLPLATKDKALIRACGAAGVVVLPRDNVICRGPLLRFIWRH